MKIFSTRPPNQPLERSEAWGFAAVNLLLWPGLGTYAAGRKVGLVQMGFSAAGVVLAFLGVLQYCLELFKSGEAPELASKPMLLFLAGLGLFAFIWTWAGVSSVFIVRSAQPKR